MVEDYALLSRKGRAIRTLQKLDEILEQGKQMDATTQAKLDAIAAQDAQELAGIQALAVSYAAVTKAFTDQLAAKDALLAETQAQLTAAKSDDEQDEAAIAAGEAKIAELQAKVDASDLTAANVLAEFNTALDKVAGDNNLNLAELAKANPQPETPTPDPTPAPPTDGTSVPPVDSGDGSSVPATDETPA